MPIRLVHTADIHLDACFAEPGGSAEHGNQRRQSLREVFSDIVRRAVEWPADALLIAGGLFEADRVTRDTVAFLRNTFQNCSPLPVFIAAGPADPCDSASPYLSESWPDNVVIFSNPAWQFRAVEGKNLTVHGFGFDAPAPPTANPFGKLEVPRDGRVHIALGHGIEPGRAAKAQVPVLPFEIRDVAVEGLTYFALGGCHETAQVKTDGCPVYYSGAPEGHGFHEPGVMKYLEIEIKRSGVDVRRVPSSRVIYRTETLDCTDIEHSEQLTDALRKLAKKSERRTVLRALLTGQADLALEEDLPVVIEKLRPEFEHIEFVIEFMLSEPYSELLRDNTSLGSFVKRISDEINDATDPSRLRLLRRTREVGLAAYRNRELPIRGHDKE